ncbi:putative baseplate assembly protein [Dyella sp. M7H15-1]|uniref:putative baseplate assembly protein n=1 Tax=Dyella sp. M7H15-1 TaxID=2501295 RepID=UPI001004F08E|nr:putative baseplate assembly protein [Dyella sp. M7H15-1]QAU23611.1 putative baseplate assembly protein [Dyella sp. M7H15-1]
MNDCQTTIEQLCGCCTGITLETPEAISNPPALPAIAYRVGRYATFNASMLAELSESAFTPLQLLSTRDSTDFSIALIDSWSVVLDILTFYQERFANEAFLRTAVDQRSVYELSALIGYVPSPGVAASAILSFTLLNAPGAPDHVPIPQGSRVQSVPGPGQTAQVFETSAAITALIDYNALPAQATVPWQLYGSDTSTWIQGTSNNISVGDVLLFVSASHGVPSNTGPGDVHYVVEVNVDSNAKMMQIVWDSELVSSFTAGMTAQQVCIYVFGKKVALYGAQAPNAASLPVSTTQYITGYNGSGADWDFDQYVIGSQMINLDASYPGLNPSTDVPQWIVLTYTQNGYAMTSFFPITVAAESNPNMYTLTTKTTQLTLAMGENLGDTIGTQIDNILSTYVSATRNVTAYIQSTQLTPANLPLAQWNDNPAYAIPAGMQAPVAGSSLTTPGAAPIAAGQPGLLIAVAGASITVNGGQQIAVGQPIGVSGLRARLQVLPSAGATFTPAQSTASLTVADNQIFLVNVYPPTVPTGGGTPNWSVQTLSGIQGTLQVANSYVQLLPASSSDPSAGEAAMVNAVTVDGDLTTLGLLSPLNGLYDATTVNVNANAVMATNGQTVQEILGSGNAANSALQFTLKQPPLTYVTAPTGNGTQSTLQVWVNNLQWQEVPNLLSSGPADRVYTTSINASGATVVRFGNGTEGACPPTGQNNIRAVYRSGIGSGGMVAAGQLSQPLDRPQGLMSVTNPSPASGAADPATAPEARASAPLPTLTIGRIVSLEDYQNFALNFAGIAKAVAAWAYYNGRCSIFLTVVGANGATFAADDPVIISLTKALRTYGNPYVPLNVVSYVPIHFQIVANIDIDETDYDPNQVMAQVWQNLGNAFAFDQLELAQNVAASTIVQIIQQTPGVIALQLQGLFPSGSPSTTVPAQLCAAGAMPPQGAQMLLLDPASQGNLGIWSP